MSRMKNVGTFLGGFGTAVAAVAAIYSIVQPSALKVEAPPDLIGGIADLTSALQGQALTLTEEQASALRERLGALETQIARAITAGDKDELPFVARSFEGLSVREQGLPYDFVAPNGVSRLLVFDEAASGSKMWIQVDGLEPSSTSGLPKIGQHTDIDFGDQTCRFVFIGVERNETITTRASCG